MLAHARLVDAAEALERKVGGTIYDVAPPGALAPVAVRGPERRVLALAQAAKAMFEGGLKVDTPPSLRVGQGLGRFAVLGSAGFELPGYADVFAPGGAWVADVVRRGTPDPNFSHVVVPTTQFAVRTGELALGRTTDAQSRARIQSFSMGMLSAVASGVVLGPAFRGLQARRTPRDWSRHDPAVDVGAAEARILGNLLGGQAGAARWQAWWPASGDVPDALFDGYIDALEEAYRLRVSRPRGFGDFEEGFAAGDPLTAVRLRNGYAFLRQDMSMHSWGPVAWWFVLLAPLAMPSIALLIARALPHGKALLIDGPDPDERSVFEVTALSMGLGALFPFGFSMWLWSQIDEHTEPFATALALFIARAALVVTSLATSGDEDQEALTRWLFLFTPLAGTDVYALIRGLIALGDDPPGDAVVWLLQTLAGGTALLVLLVGALVRPFGDAIDDVDAAYWILWAVLTVGLLAGLGIPLAIALSNGGGIRSLFLRERLEQFPLLSGVAAAAAPGNPLGLVHAFDDSTVWHDPAVAAPTLADLRYPAGRRALVRIWWTGAGTLEVNQVGSTVKFLQEDGTRTDVRVPIGRATAADLAAVLLAQLPGLQTEVVAAGDPAYELPFPQTLADPGDTGPTHVHHDAHAGDFEAVGTTRETAYLLRHTPRGKLATPYGIRGPSANPLDGLAVVPQGTFADVDHSALGLAADLAVLLCLGSAPSLADAPIVPGPRPPQPALPALTPVYQVFRQWNLDERRVNEWRMVVQGGAESEKGGRPLDRDPAMRPNPNAAAPPYQSLAPAGEPLAAAMGWIPLWRAWLRMATDVTADSTAATPMPYTPTVATRDGRSFQPTNADLSTAVRFLLDLA